MGGTRSNRYEGGVDVAPAEGADGAFAAAAAVLLIGGLTALGVVLWGTIDPVLLTLVTFLAALGLFFALALLAGHIRLSGRSSDSSLLRSVVEGLDEAVLVADRSGEVVLANAAFRKLLGGSGAGTATIEALFPSSTEPQEAIFRLHRAAQRGEQRTEVASFTLDGQDRWLRLSVRPLVATPDAAPTLVLWEIGDVSAERRREAAAHGALVDRVAEIDAMAAGLLVSDADGRVVHTNATLARWLRVPKSSQAETAELRLTDLMSPDSAQLLLRMTQQPVSSLQRIDLDLVRRGGIVFPASLLVATREHTDGLIAIVVNRNDLDRRAGEVSSGTSQFFETAPIGIATLRDDGTLLDANSAFDRLLMLPRPATGTPAVAALCRSGEIEARKAIAAAVDDALAGKLRIAPVEITVGANREFTRQLYFSPVARPSDAREAAVVYLIDATEQKALELKFAQSQKMEAVGKLAGGIAHDFNNVLTAIIGWSDLLLGNQKPGAPGFQHLMSIKSSANRAAGLVSHLLAFARQQTLQPEVLHLGEVLTDLSVLLNRLLGEKIELKIQQGRDLWLVKADKTQLGQVVINLAVNARDAMPSGGRLTVRTRNIAERESARLARHGIGVGEYVLIEVEDTGTGMPAEVMAKVFEPFFTTKGIGKGTGLGLSTVFGIVRQTGGYIVPESEVGKGTTFRVYLPRHAADTAALVPVASRGERTTDLTGSGRVLVVEDEDAVRGFAVEALRRQGYDVLQASNGREALEVLAEAGGVVDLVVSDVIMPEMDGPTLFGELRKLKPEIRMIFVSGYPDDALKTTLDHQASFAFLQKPFSLAQLAAKVKAEITR